MCSGPQYKRRPAPSGSRAKRVKSVLGVGIGIALLALPLGWVLMLSTSGVNLADSVISMAATIVPLAVGGALVALIVSSAGRHNATK